MNEPTYNDHAVTPKGWLLYDVTSASRERVVHRVDLEADEFERATCSCEAYEIQKHRPCRHILAVCTYITDGLEQTAAKHRVLELLVRYVSDEPVNNILSIIQEDKSAPKRQYKLQYAA